MSVSCQLLCISLCYRGTNSVSDDPEAYHGAPVAVQIVGRRLTEEKILVIAEEVGRLLGNAITP